MTMPRKKKPKQHAADGVAPTGRVSILTPAFISDVAALLVAGNHQDAVAEYKGISRTTWKRWLDEGQHIAAGGSAAKGPNGTIYEPDLKREFWNVVQQSRAKAEVRNVAIVNRRAQNGDVRAAIWWLEHARPQRWGNRSVIALEGGDPNKPVRLQDLRASYDDADTDDATGT